jgi:hypothetical protein
MSSIVPGPGRFYCTPSSLFAFPSTCRVRSTASSHRPPHVFHRLASATLQINLWDASPFLFLGFEPCARPLRRAMSEGERARPREAPETAQRSQRHQAKTPQEPPETGTAQNSTMNSWEASALAVGDHPIAMRPKQYLRIDGMPAETRVTIVPSACAAQSTSDT